MKSRTGLAPISSSTFSFSCGIRCHARHCREAVRSPSPQAPVFTESAWIVPSSKRSLTAALTRRCWSIRERPSNCGAVTVARRWSPSPVFVADLDLGAGQRRLDHRLQLRQVGHWRGFYGRSELRRAHGRMSGAITP